MHVTSASCGRATLKNLNMKMLQSHGPVTNSLIKKTIYICVRAGTVINFLAFGFFMGE